MPTTRTNLGSFLAWFALLGGAVAWAMHFLLAYLLAEFGCLTAMRGVRLLGITAIAWAILLVTVVMLAIAIAALLVAHRQQRWLTDRATDASANLRFVARFGRIGNALFAFIIVFQTIPIFFYLGDC